MAITKPPVLPAWADTAANPADIVQPTNPQISAGWPLSTTPPSRQRWNWVLNFCMNAVRYFSRRGIADYDATETYMSHDITRGTDGKLYRSIQDNNINHSPPSASWWGSPAIPTPAADDASSSAASTAYVIGQISVTLPSMDGTAAIGASFKFARADHVHPSDSSKANTSGTYNGLTVGFANIANSVPFSGVTNKPNTCAGYGIVDSITTSTIGAQSVAHATTADRAYPYTWAGGDFRVFWSGQPGQPNWLLGGNDGTNFYAYNPANFSVNHATTADFATNANHAVNADSATNVVNLPNIGNMPGVVLQADPGGVPTGAPGQMFLYY